MMDALLVDADRTEARKVRDRLAIPAIADIHVHVMPPRVMAAVWRYFESAGPLLGRDWPVRYRGTDDQRLHFLRSQGVGLFAGLAYAHKPGISRFLTDWSLDYAARTPGAVATGTFFPEPEALSGVTGAIESGCQLFKVHLQVGDIDPLDPHLTPVWSVLQATGVPTIIHAGHSPAPGRFTGVTRIKELLRAFPNLPLIVAHFGAPDEGQFVDLAMQFPNVGLDTTMVGCDFIPESGQLTPAVLGRIRELGLDGRVYFGTDFPNIPYPYDHQLEAIVRWGLGDEWLRHVLWLNSARLLGAG